MMLQQIGDLISRQAVLDCLTARGLKKFDFILDARDKIKNLPPVNPQEPMRDFTEEEAKAYSKALDKMYKPTGFNVFNEPSGDLISRQAVLNILEREGHKWGNDYRDWVDAVNEVETLPSVNPQEPKTGHWKAKSFHELFCDNCGFDFDIMRNDFIDKMNYCPNCGRCMVDPQEKLDSE